MNGNFTHERRGTHLLQSPTEGKARGEGISRYPEASDEAKSVRNKAWSKQTRTSKRRHPLGSGVQIEEPETLFRTKMMGEMTFAHLGWSAKKNPIGHV
jgi:hypothetical protein